MTASHRAILSRALFSFIYYARLYAYTEKTKIFVYPSRRISCAKWSTDNGALPSALVLMMT
jgi:hypothetical protein